MAVNYVFFFYFVQVQCIFQYYIDSDGIPGFFMLLKNDISSSREVKILFLYFTCVDIDVVIMQVTGMISQ